MKKNRKALLLVVCIYMIMLIGLLILILPVAIEVIRSELIYKLSVDTIMLLVIFLIVCISFLAVMLYGMYNTIEKNKEKHENSIGNIKLDDERSYLERQINDLNRKLLSTEERWKEAYHLIMSSQMKQKDMSGIVSTANYLKGFGIDIDNITIQGNYVFVLTPFHNDFLHTYSVIKEVCTNMKLSSMRGDEEFVTNDILQHVVKCIVKARVIIANLDGRNPNVFYELGIAHALNKPTILLANVNTEIPFDIQNQYLVLYEDEKQLKDRLNNALLNVLTNNP